MYKKNDFDLWQDAINEMDLSEAVAPIVRGVTLLEDTQVEMYNKIQKLLNSTGMESCHQFLYNLDPSELSESECAKVNNLFKLGQERGFIGTDDEVAEDEDTADDKAEEVKKECDVAAAPLPVATPVVPLKQSAFTILYSATRDGVIKNGEAFSNCINTRSAKADVISKLERAGYQNIQILAIEAGDPDMAGCDNTYCKQAEVAAEVPDYAVEADDREPMSHALDAAGIKASTADLKGQNTAEVSVVTDDNSEVDEDDMLDGRTHNGHVDEKDEEDKADDKADDKDKKEEAVEEPDEKLKDDTTEDKADNKKDDDKAEDKGEEDEEDKELSAEEKETLKDSYKKAFKAAMKKLKFEVCFAELSLEQKVEFFTELSKAWGDKADPAKFMTDKETEQLEKIVVKQ